MSETLRVEIQKSDFELRKFGVSLEFWIKFELKVLKGNTQNN